MSEIVPSAQGPNAALALSWGPAFGSAAVAKVARKVNFRIRGLTKPTAVDSARHVLYRVIDSGLVGREIYFW